MNPEEKLKALNRVLEHSKAAPFYKNRLPGRPLRSLKELQNIPFTTKEDLRQHSPFGLLCLPQKQLYQYHESFGTTGNPVSVWFSREELRDNARCVSRWGVNFNEDDIVLVRFPYAISSVAHAVHAAAQLKRACVLPVSSRTTVSPFPRVVRLMQKLGVTVLACLPMQAVLIAETAEMMDLDPRADFPRLRALCTAGEILSPGRRRLLENIWGVPVFDNYGLTETGPAVLDCSCGTPHPLSQRLFIELLDEDLQREVKPGTTGYLVLTTLGKRAVPLIRYLTGDRARLVEKKCSCGKELSLEIRGRREDTLAVGSLVLDAWDMQEIVSALPGCRFWAAGPRPGGLHLVVEKEKAGRGMAPEIIAELEKAYQIKFHIDVLPRGTLCNRELLLSEGEVGKPKYIFTAMEMQEQKFAGAAVI